MISAIRGNTWAAAAVASVKELMARMGHASTRAAMIYLHSTRERDKEIAKGLGKRIAAPLVTGMAGHDEQPSGTQRARKRKRGS